MVKEEKIVEICKEMISKVVDFLPEGWEELKYRICLNEGFYKGYFYVRVGFNWIYCYDLPKSYDVSMDELDDLDDDISDMFLIDDISKPIELIVSLDRDGKFTVNFDYYRAENEALDWKSHEQWVDENINIVDLKEDIFKLSSFDSTPLIPYLTKDKKRLGYVFVVFEDEEIENKLLIKRISHVWVRDKDKKEELKFKKEHISLNFPKEQVEMYQEESEKYFELLNEGKFEEALTIFNRIVSDDLRHLFEEIFE